MLFRFSIEFQITRNGPSRLLTRDSFRRLRRQVATRDNYICHYCGIYTQDGAVDHVIPLSEGGTDDIDNLVWSCSECNQAKGAELLDQWRETDKLRQLADLSQDPISDDGTMIPELQEFYDNIKSHGTTALRHWEGKVLPRNTYCLFRDALIGHGYAQWNAYASNGEPHVRQGWSLVDDDGDQQPEQLRFRT